MSLSSKKITQKISDFNSFPTPIIAKEQRTTITRDDHRLDYLNDIYTDLNSNTKIVKPAENSTTMNHTNNCIIKDSEYLNNNFVKSLNLDRKIEDKSLVYINHNEEKEQIKESQIELNFRQEQNLNKTIDGHK
jgi:hypothetical protein